MVGAVAGPAFYFLRARYYDPDTGRFISRDLIEFNQRYAYVGNNPVSYTDPLGLAATRPLMNSPMETVAPARDLACPERKLTEETLVPGQCARGFLLSPRPVNPSDGFLEGLASGMRTFFEVGREAELRQFEGQQAVNTVIREKGVDTALSRTPDCYGTVAVYGFITYLALKAGPPGLVVLSMHLHNWAENVATSCMYRR